MKKYLACIIIAFTLTSCAKVQGSLEPIKTSTEQPTTEATVKPIPTEAPAPTAENRDELDENKCYKFLKEKKIQCNELVVKDLKLVVYEKPGDLDSKYLIYTGDILECICVVKTPTNQTLQYRLYMDPYTCQIMGISSEDIEFNDLTELEVNENGVMCVTYEYYQEYVLTH